MMSKQVWAGAVVGAMSLLSGCGGGFFIDGTTTTTATSSTGDYVYAVNSSNNSINAYDVGSGSLTLVSGSPLTAATGLLASSVAVSRGNSFVYVGGLGTISSYTIGSTGALTLLATQAASAQSTNFAALDVSPDGQWLLAMDSFTFTVFVFKINTSTGALALNQTATYNPASTATATPRGMRIAPTGNFVAVALGLGGDVVGTFNTTTGALTLPNVLTPTGSNSDNAVAFDSTGNYLFIARGAASQVATYTVGNTGGLTSGSTVAAGNSPYTLLLESAGTYLYTSNRSDATVSGYTAAAGVLTALSGSPYPSGSLPSALVEDKSHSYIVSYGANGSTDLTLYKLDALTNGKLDAVATAASGATGTGSSVALAATHGGSVTQ